MYVDRCVYFDGFHVYAAVNCPHNRTEDETGRVIEPGWTVQSG